ncbi:membrane protein insertion efficiency factor YidD (plasmid) [Pseudomonas sp. Leaf58]|uniref:membrane protein insertion efficiency factor YidD n=1 Tax=Pseudomonas sp. Leaf58 TaxID=1736226 RepID=UPI0009E99742|nr:membrane protein insertion efficiency factor YidD [Pseudomonas sp. Leaf58]AYG48176.1 membrane protein insertion efficiency factor YidD [Pseudomonas sp. Leaf58]
MGIYRFGISLYQKHLSPRKGYRCAHSLEYGGPGCSGAVLEILETQGLIRGLSSIRSRFLSCQEAAETRRERKKREAEDRKRRNDSSGGGSPNSSCCLTEVAGDAVDCLPDASKCRIPDLPDCGSCGPDASCTSLKFLLGREHP